MNKMQKIFAAMNNGKTILGVGPMSWNFIDVVIEVANENKIPIPLVASRGQIECEEIGGGYVTTTQKLAKHVKEKDKGGYVTLSRDHGSLWKGKGEAKLPYKLAHQRSMISLCADIANDFDVLHLDVTAKSGKIFELYARQDILINECLSVAKKNNKNIFFEVGIDAHSSKITNLPNFIEFMNLGFNQAVKFVGGNTGLYVRGRANSSAFDVQVAKQLVATCKNKEMYYRQHNADYIEGLTILHRTGIPSVNVAPEYGVKETFCMLHLLENHGFTKEKKELLNIFYKSKKWKKWTNRWSYDKQNLALMAGHYMFEDERVKEIKTKAQTIIPLEETLKYYLKLILTEHLKQCGWEIKHEKNSIHDRL